MGGWVYIMEGRRGSKEKDGGGSKGGGSRVWLVGKEREGGEEGGRRGENDKL